MDGIAKDIMVNFLSDALFVFFSLIIGAVLYRATERTKLLSFFGIDKSREIYIYLSNLDVTAYGAKGIDGKPKSYQGEAVSYKELESAYKLKELFTYSLPTWGDKPNILEKILLADIKVHILTANNVENLDNKTTVIVLGSPAYNVAAKFCENELQSQAKVIEQLIPVQTENHGILGLFVAENQNSGTLPSGTSSAFDDRYFQNSNANATNYSKEIAITINGKATMTDPLIGFIEKIWDKKHQRSVFYIAGISEIATASACYYLFVNWKKLLQYPNQEFVVSVQSNPLDYTKSKLIF